MDRRRFLQVSAAGTALLAADMPAALGREEKHLLPNALGLLYDSTICIGCKACVSACKEANGMPPEFGTREQIWDEPIDLSSKTLNIIKIFKTGKALNRNSPEDGYSFVKRQCQHCVDPGCVSACPASAMTKNQQTGIVEYNKSNCIGCRYCQVACPFEVPKFEWDKALPQIRKCELCRHRQKDGKIPACAEACPTGATLFGRTSDLLKEAHRRLDAKAGESYDFPLNTVDSKGKASRPMVGYNGKVYGEHDGGGTQCIMLASVPFEKLGMPKLPERSFAVLSENIQHSLYKGMIAPAVVFVGLLAAAYRNTTKGGK